MDFLQRLSRALDRPLFPWKNLLMGFSVGHYLFETFLNIRQYRVLQRTEPPAVMAKEVTRENFDKSQAYGRAKTKFQIIDGLWDVVQNLAFIHYDVLPKLWSFTGDLLDRFVAPYAPRFTGEISHSVVFILGFLFVQQALNIVPRVYYTFVLEQKFGFNKQSAQIFVSDMVKTNLLTVALLPPVVAAFLKIVKSTGNQFFFYLWAFAASLQLFMTAAYPTVILPLFNKLTPLPPGELKTKVDDLAASLKFPLSDLYVIDGSKRSSHSNAYFFGFPWKKHIVLYDTLIEGSEPSEVTAVLGHELGHWKFGHTTSLFFITETHLLYIFTLFSVFINNASLYSAFGFVAEKPIIIGFLLFNDVLTPMDMLVKFFLNTVTRRFEFQADKFAQDLGYATDLARSLLKLHTQNLSNVDADPFYATYHYSHPHITERLNAIGWKGEEKVKGATLNDDGENVAKVTGRDEL